MSDETPEIVLNEFGDLSRKAKRELLALGIDPDTAVVEHLRTASIPVIRSSDVLPAPSPASAPAVAPTPAPTSMPAPASVSTSGLVSQASYIASAATEKLMPELNRAPRHSGALDERGNVTPATFETRRSRRQSRVESVEPVEPVKSVEPVKPVESVQPRDYDSRSAVTPTFADPDLEPAAVRISDLRQVAEGADLEPFSMATTASIGVVTSASHALILPSLPEDTGTIAPLLSTGETLVTGSIILPSTLGQLGADAQSLDTFEVDVIDDDHDVIPSQDLAPVSATLAVSSYNSSASVVTVPRKVSDRLPLFLAITAAVLAVGVVGLFVAGYFLRIF